MISFFKNIFKKSDPIDKFYVDINSTTVTITHPERDTEKVEWKDIQSIKIITTDEGPFLPDFWLALIGTNEGCLIPLGCQGYDKVYNIVSKYDNFDFKKVIEASTSTDNNEFFIYKKNT